MELLYSEVLSLAWRVDEEIGAYSCGQIHVFQVVVAYFHSFFALLYFKRNNQNELLLKDRQENAIFYNCLFHYSSRNRTTF
jgi:hypothetical protein